MLIDDAVTKLRSVDAARRSAASVDLLSMAVSDIASLRAWLDGCETDISTAMAGRVTLLERDLAVAGRTTERAAGRVIERAATAAALPTLGGLMAAGEASGAHLDVITAAAKTLEPAQRAKFREQLDRHPDQATRGTVEDYRGFVQHTARQLQADGGTRLLERQRRDTRLRTWTDRETGMWRVSGRFDPETGVRLASKLDGALSRLLAEPTPPEAPSDPAERVDFLRAQAFAELCVTGGGAAAGRPEMVIVIDTRTSNITSLPIASPQARRVTAGSDSTANPARLDARTVSGSVEADAPASLPGAALALGVSAIAEASASLPGAVQELLHERRSPSTSASSIRRKKAREPDPTEAANPTMPVKPSPPMMSSSSPPEDAPHVDWGIPVTLPWEAVCRLITEDQASTHAVIVDGASIVYAPGQLDLGRSTRLANHAQRRALRAIYPTCAVPGCDMHFNRTEAHHVMWWEQGGRTDLDNLLPLCSRHHHDVHDNGWHLRLDQHRHLTITLPDGTQLTGSPPATRRRNAA